MKKFICFAVALIITLAVIPANADSYNSSNNRQFGIVAALDDWVYFSDIVYMNNESHLYKMRQDGTEKTLLSDDNVSQINIIGDWIYYINSWNEYGESNSLYKIKTDGASRTQIQIINPDAIGDFQIAGGWIYYTIYNKKNLNLYKMKTDGTEKMLLSAAEDDCGYLNIADDWVYYTNYNDNWVYKVRTDGTERSKVTPEIRGSADISNGWIYYTDNYSINKIRIDGTEYTEFNSGYNVQSSYLNIDGEWIYFLEWNFNLGNNPTICKIRTDGTAKTELLQYNWSGSGNFFLNVAGDWVYFPMQEDNNYLYRVKTDGSIVEKLYGSEVERIYEAPVESDSPPTGDALNDILKLSIITMICVLALKFMQLRNYKLM